MTLMLNNVRESINLTVGVRTYVRTYVDRSRDP